MVDRAELLRRVDALLADLVDLRQLETPAIAHARLARAARRLRDLLVAGADDAAIAPVLRELEDARRGLFGA